MTKTISTLEARDRLMKRLDQSAGEAADWRNIIGIEGNRTLLALIARGRPDSIAQLAQLAGRAQPNVSRSLAALVRAGLVELISSGRVTRPQLTELGRDKAGALDLFEGDEGIEHRELGAPEIDEQKLFSAVHGHAENLNSDEIKGFLAINLRMSSAFYWSGRTAEIDLNSLSIKVASDWWRIFYRRDSSYKISDQVFIEPGSDLLGTLYLRSWGKHIDALVVKRGSQAIERSPFQKIPLAVCQNALIDHVLTPVAQAVGAKGRRDRPIHSLLGRLEETLAQPKEAEFARSAGALGVSPYELSDHLDDLIIRLIGEFPEEETRLDFASAVLSAELEAGTAWLEREAATKSGLNQLPGLIDVAERCRSKAKEESGKAWQRGISAAKEVRRLLQLSDTQPVGGLDGLTKLLGGGSHFTTSPKAPGALRGVLTKLNSTPSIFVEYDGNCANSTFLMGRAMGDFVAYGENRACVADLYTDRQAVGRAFAAELIAPASAVVHMADDEGLSLQKIADHFGASSAVIRHQYENNTH